MNQSIAVIIPSFNRKLTLGRALDSVYAQTRPANEVIVVDDGSTDGTREFVAEHYPDTKYIFQDNSGVSAARNVGIENSSAAWIAFLDSDDEWLPQKLELQISAIVDKPSYKIVHTNEIWIRNGVRVNQMNKHQKYGGFIFDRCLPICAISPSSAMLSRELLLEVGGFDESLPACEDYDLWLKVCCRYSVLFIDQPLLKKYGGHDDQLSSKYWGMDRFRVKALQNILAGSSLKAEQAQIARATLIKKCKILCNGAAKRGRSEDQQHYRELIAMHSSDQQEI